MNNKIEISGRILEDFSFEYEYNGEKFYTTKIESKRLSGVIDVATLLVSEYVVYTGESLKSKYVFIDGEIKTYNKDRHLKIFIDVKELDIINIDNNETIDDNSVELKGFICKIDPIRNTPGGRTICNVILANNYDNKKNNYIPIIFWGNKAESISSYDIGTEISIVGRFQSRKYNKNDKECCTYEISVQDVNIVA